MNHMNRDDLEKLSNYTLNLRKFVRLGMETDEREGH